MGGMEGLNALVGHSRSGFDVDTLADCRKVLHEGLLGDFRLCKAHPFLTRLSATLVSGSDAERNDALELLAWVARSPDNAEPVLFALEECGESLEKYTAQHTALDGHRDKPDDKIYRSLLTVLMCSSGFTFRASQLLELTDGKMALAIAAIASVLRGPFGQAPLAELMAGDPLLWQSSVRLVACAAKVLCDLTTCDAYFQSSDARDYETIAIAELNKEFSLNIAEVSRVVIMFPVFDLMTVHLEEWFQVVRKEFSHSMQGILRLCGGREADIKAPPLVASAVFLLDHLEAGLSSALLTISHLLTYTTEYSSRLRRFVANHTILIQNLVLPYAVFLCDTLERTQTDDERQAMSGRIKHLLNIIKVLSFLTFRVKVFRPWFRTRNFSSRLLRSDLLMGSNIRANLVALLARLNVNIDAGDASHTGYSELLTLFRSAYDAMPDAERNRLSAALSRPTELMYPVNKLCPTYRDLSYLWGSSHAAGGDADAAAAAATTTSDGTDSAQSSLQSTPETTGFRFEFNFKGVEPFSLAGGCAGSSSGGSSRPKGCTLGGGGGSRFGGGRKAGAGRGGGRGRGVRMWGSHRMRPYQTARQRHRQRQVLEKRWKELRKQRQIEGVAGCSTEAPLVSDASTPPFGGGGEEGAGPAAGKEASPASPDGEGGKPQADAMLEVTTDSIRSDLRRQSQPDAAYPTAPAWLSTGWGCGSGGGGGGVSPLTSPSGRVVQRDDASPVVAIFKPTKLAPLGAPPGGLVMNSMFGGPRGGGGGGGGGGDASLGEGGDPHAHRTRILWEPGTEVAREGLAAAGGDFEVDGGGGGSGDVEGGEDGGGEDGEGEGEGSEGGAGRFRTVVGEEDVVPSAFLCSLSHQLLLQPVISPYGDAFERAAILAWFEESGNTCPVTQKPLEVTDLVPDYELKRDIEEYRLKARIESVL